MTYEKCRAHQAKKCLLWIQRYPGWWYLICTPGEEHMTLHMMRMLLEKLQKESLYELIFVMLTVHRQAPFMENFFQFALLDRLTDRWEDDGERILKEFLEYFK